MTFSAWVKRASASATNCMFATGVGAERSMILFESSGRLQFSRYNSNYIWHLATNRLFRDTNAWYHVVCALDTTQSTASDRAKIWINGVQETSLSTSTYPSLNYDDGFNTSGKTQYVGQDSDGNQDYNGCMTHVHYIDGTAYTPSTFGQTDATTGEWSINTSPTLTMGTNGFTILKDGTTITDQSSNSNNFSVGAGTLTFTHDNPSNIFCVLNDITSKNKPSLANGNTKTNTSSDGQYVFGTIGSKAGYYEIKLGQNPNGGNGNGLTFGTYDANFDDTQTNSTNVRMYKTNHAYSTNYSIDVGNGAGTTTGVAAAAGDIINVAWKNGKLYCGKNGTYFFSANPSNNTDGSTQVTMADSNAYQLPISKSNVDGMTNSEWNFGNGYFGTTAITTNSGNGYTDANGQGKFQYQPPTGCYALCTKNLNI